jgi:plastocyanin domain-containing protein
MEPISLNDALVIAGGLAAIAWVNWYFFLAGRDAASAVAAASPAGGAAHAGPASVTITVDGGYSPQLVRVKVGQPVRLVFDRKDTGSCSEEIVLPDFGVRRFLPTGERTTIEVTPPKAGRYEFTCGMSMLRGAIIAED